MIKDVIDKWSIENEAHTRGSYFRMFAFNSLLIAIKSENFTIEDINEDVAIHILNKFTPELPKLAKDQLQTIMGYELSKACKIILGGKSGYIETEYKEIENKPIEPKTPKSTDVYEQSEGEESVDFDRNLVKDKQFDLDILADLGIDIKDLANE